MSKENTFWDEYKLIDTINKTDKVKIEIAMVKKGKTQGLDIREFYKEGNKWIPGKGVVVPKNKIQQLRDALSTVYLDFKI